MSNLSIFAFEGQQVRCMGTAEQPEWIAADICGILGLDTSLTVNGRPDRPGSGLDPDEKGTDNGSTPGGEQFLLTVTEPGLYRLLSKSRKEIAKRFQRWLFHDVLPSIRKTGSYSINTVVPTRALPSVKERLESIQLAIQLFQQLGGCDPRTELLLKDYIRNIVLEEKLQPTLPGRVEWPVSDRAVMLGYRPSPSQLRKIGKQAARLYQERHGQKPVQREQFVGGTTRMVNVYSEADADVLDKAIVLVMKESRQ